MWIRGNCMQLSCGLPECALTCPVEVSVYSRDVIQDASVQARSYSRSRRRVGSSCWRFCPLTSLQACRPRAWALSCNIFRVPAARFKPWVWHLQSRAQRAAAGPSRRVGVRAAKLPAAHSERCRPLSSRSCTEHRGCLPFSPTLAYAARACRPGRSSDAA